MRVTSPTPCNAATSGETTSIGCELEKPSCRMRVPVTSTVSSFCSWAASWADCWAASCSDCALASSFARALRQQ